MIKTHEKILATISLLMLLSSIGFGQRPWLQMEHNENLMPESPISGNSIWSEDFEGSSSFPTNGITTSSLGSDGGFTIESTTGPGWHVPTRSKYAVTNDDLCNCDKSNDLLQLPTQNFSGQQSVFIESDIFHDMSSGDGMVYLEIDTGNGWHTIDSVGASNNWKLFQRGLPGAGGKSAYDIRFKYDDKGAWATGCAIDNIRLVEPFNDFDVELSKPWTDNLPLFETTSYQQSGNSLYFPTAAENIGQKSLTNVKGTQYISGQEKGLIAFQNTSLFPGAQSKMSVLDPFMFGPETGQYAFTQVLSHDSLTADKNDTLISRVWLTDSTISHDLSLYDTTALWFGPGIQYQLTHYFQFNKPDTITSAYVYIDEQTAADSRINLWLYNGFDNPLRFEFNILITQEDVGNYKLIDIPPTPVDSGIVKLGVESNSDSVVLKCAALPFVSENARLRINSNISQTRFLVIAGLNTRNSACQTEVSINKYPTTCGQSDGAIKLNFSESIKHIQWTWKDTAIYQGDSLGQLGAGVYQFTAVDTNGCVAKKAVGLSSTNAITLDSVTTQPTSCASDTSGVIVIHARGNQLRYQLNNGAAKPDSLFTGLNAGIYEARIWEAASPGCETIETIEISGGKSALQVSFNTTDNRCSQETNGSVIAQVNGGVSPYSFSWNSDTTNIPYLKGIQSGTYALTVTDAAGCSTTQSTVVSSLPPIRISPLTDDQAGFIVLNASGGVGSLEYNWSGPNGYRNPGTDSIGDLISKGSYRVTITDDARCQLETSFNMHGAISAEEYQNAAKYRIYPNPTKDYLSVESTTPVSICLYSTEGRILLRSNFDERHKIDMSEYPQGMYFLTVTSGDRETFKIIKQ